ncbi:MAG: hypothetical protein L0H84_05170 [Pseudonocardia sp.]|nr:hypothetical protein [Pseudonocardia sp.]
MEGELVRRVLAALLREDHLGLHTRGRLDGDLWTAPLPDGRRAVFAVERDGFLAEHTAAALTVAGQPVDTLAGVLAALAPAESDAEATAGWADFATECAAALDAAHDQLPLDPPGPRTGYAGLLRYDALAAAHGHPVYPTGRARPGLDAAARRAFAPEFARPFTLRWRFVARDGLRISPGLAADPPTWWPPAPDGWFALPAHPLTAPDGPCGPTVVATLSMRTLALVDEPGVHVKVPLAVSALGSRNRRTIKPGTLADGAAMHALLAAVLDREPELAGSVLLADERRFAEGPTEDVAVLVRHLPPAVADDRLASLAALPVRDPRTGTTVLDDLAGDDRAGWFDRYLSVLLDWHVALWVRYGIALESHQQNITVADGAGRIRLVYKDDDGARVDAAHVTAALGHPPPVFADVRMLAADPTELADLFVTITLHLCVRAVAPDPALLHGVRDRIAAAADRWCDRGEPRSVAARAAVHRMLAARRWPVKAMVTAGTLLPKTRLGCTDVNKHYVRTGPNYLEG